MRDTYPAIFDSVFSALVFIYKIHDVITEWVCDGVECYQIGNMSSLLSGVGFKCKNPYVVKSEKLLMAPKNSYYLSNHYVGSFIPKIRSGGNIFLPFVGYFKRSITFPIKKFTRISCVVVLLD